MASKEEKLRKLQELIGYKFKNEELLIQALTTPQLGNEIGKPNYDFLETLGDAIIKLIFILKLYQIGIEDSGTITKIKATLESDKALNEIAQKIKLENYIFKTETQIIKGTRILADVFEAVCGALFLDSDCKLYTVKEKIIDRFYEDLDFIIKDDIMFNKNSLLEYLQEKFKTSILIKLKYEKSGFEHDPIWIAKNPKILEKHKNIRLIEIPHNLKSGKFVKKKDAEKDIYFKILEYLRKKEK